MDNLGYFIEWGGSAWEWVVGRAIRDFAGLDLTGQSILDIGARSGKMSAMFALLGADVTAVDINKDCMPQVVAEAVKWKVQDKVTFIAYDGNLEIFPDGSFDVVFTKSVLVVVPKLDDFLGQIERMLKPGGKVIFIENGKGNALVHLVRRLRHRGWDYKKARFFTEKEVGLIGERFDIERVERTSFPPVYSLLAHGKKKGRANRPTL